MFWFKSKRHVHPQEIRVPKLSFLGEQDGPSEQILKEKLLKFFLKDQSIYRAYLAIIETGNNPSVALCLKTQFGPDKGIAEKIGAIFKTIFAPDVYLDILFLNEEQEKDVALVCKPFFVRNDSGSDLSPKN